MAAAPGEVVGMINMAGHLWSVPVRWSLVGRLLDEWSQQLPRWPSSLRLTDGGVSLGDGSQGGQEGQEDAEFG